VVANATRKSVEALRKGVAEVAKKRRRVSARVLSR
jgi:hypothetical protein